MLSKIIGKGNQKSFKHSQPIDIIGDNFIKLKNDHTVFILEVDYPGMFFLDEGEITDKIIDPIKRNCKELPDGTNITFKYMSKPGYPEFDDLETDTYIDKTLNNFYRQKETTEVKSYIIISFPRAYNASYFTLAADEGIVRSESRTGKKGKIKEEDIRSYFPYIKSLTNDLKEVCKVRLLNTGTELIRYADDYSNLKFFDKDNKVDSFKDNDSYVTAGRKVFSIISLKNNPDTSISEFSFPSFTRDSKKKAETSLEMPASFVHSLGLGLNIPHITTLNFTVQSTPLFSRQLREKVVNAAGGLGAPFDNNANKAEIVKMMTEVVEDSPHERYVTYSLNTMVVASSKDELDGMLEMTREAYLKLNFKPIDENFLNMEVFMSNFAGNGFENPRIHLGNLSQMTCLFPFETPGTFSPQGIPVATKADTIGHLDLFNRKAHFGNKQVVRTNINMLISGKSGGGKSNLMAMIMKHLVDHHGARLIVLDKGNSFNRAIQLLGGKKYEYTDEKPLSFNPFMIEMDDNGKVIYTRDNLSILSPVILACIEEAFDKVELSLIRDILNDHILKGYFEAYNKGDIKKLKFDTFFVYVSNYEEMAIKKGSSDRVYQRINNNFPFGKFLTVTEKFRTGNTHGDLLNADENFDIVKNKITLFELDKIQSDEFLFRIVSICISLLANDLFKNKKLDGVMKYLFVDEATFVMKDFMADVFAGLYQTARKHFAGVGIADQTFDALEKSGVINRVLTNTDTVVWLRQKDVKQNWDLIKRTFGYTERELRRIRGIEIGKDFREGVLHVGEESFFSFRVYQSKEMYLAFNTDNERMQDRINKMLDNYLEMFGSEKASFRQIKEDINDGII